MTKTEIKKHYKEIKTYSICLAVSIVILIILGGLNAIIDIYWWMYLIVSIISVFFIFLIVFSIVTFSKLKQAIINKPVQKPQSKVAKSSRVNNSSRKKLKNLENENSDSNTKTKSADIGSVKIDTENKHLAQSEAMDALVSLGYKKKEAETVVKSLSLTGNETSEEIIRMCLKGKM